MHKAIHTFLSKNKRDIETGVFSKIEIVVEDLISDLVLSHFLDVIEHEENMVNKRNYIVEFKVVEIDTRVEDVTHKLKKIFFGIL